MNSPLETSIMTITRRLTGCFDGKSEQILRAHLLQASASMLRQLCDDTAVIEINGVAPVWGCRPIVKDFEGLVKWMSEF